jgi:hypothetical protein
MKLVFCSPQGYRNEEERTDIIKGDKLIQYMFEENLECLLNAYNDGCQHYLAKEVDVHKHSKKHIFMKSDKSLTIILKNLVLQHVFNIFVKFMKNGIKRLRKISIIDPLSNHDVNTIPENVWHFSNDYLHFKCMRY